MSAVVWLSIAACLSLSSGLYYTIWTIRQRISMKKLYQTGATTNAIVTDKQCIRKHFSNSHKHYSNKNHMISYQFIGVSPCQQAVETNTPFQVSFVTQNQHYVPSWQYDCFNVGDMVTVYYDKNDFMNQELEMMIKDAICETFNTLPMIVIVIVGCAIIGLVFIFLINDIIAQLISVAVSILLGIMMGVSCKNAISRVDVEIMPIQQDINGFLQFIQRLSQSNIQNPLWINDFQQSGFDYQSYINQVNAAANPVNNNMSHNNVGAANINAQYAA